MSARRTFVARRVAVIVLVVATTAFVAMQVWGGSPRRRETSTPRSTNPANPGRGVPPRAAVVHDFMEKVIGTLPAAVQDSAAAAFGSDVRFAGGLDRSDTSTAQVVRVAGGAGQVIGSLPAALHDAAGAGIGGALYVFGGGDGTRQLDSILRVDASGNASVVGTLPAPSSDSSAAVIGNTAYVVGGYTGTRWLDTVVAFTPGRPVRVVAHLPTAVRYAAVGAADGRLVIAGGSTPAAFAGTAVYSFAPRTGAVARVGDLPVALTHASAAGLGTEVVVVGGEDSSHAPVGSITAIDAARRRIRPAGHLVTPRSDAALVRTGARLQLLGGHDASGTLASVSAIVPVVVPVRVDVYSHDGAGALRGAARMARSLVYVPNSQSDTVDVIDPATMKVVDHFAVGLLPQHVTPSWDLKTLYVDNDHGNSLTPIDPTTGKVSGPPIPVSDPYNLYFTPDGRYAMVVAEALSRLDFRDPRSMQLVESVPVPCHGVDHMDFTADGTLALASCEFSGQMIVVDVRNPRVVRTIPLPRPSSRPQDVKLSPDGSIFYVADMTNNGLWEIDARTFAVLGLLPTGRGAHGLYPSRDAKQLYVTNRDAGTISVVDFGTRAVVATWSIPGGSPDMGGVSADGSVLWLSGRYNAEVYAISTADGHLIARIPVGRGPHGLCVWPQPGRYSMGHTGIMR